MRRFIFKKRSLTLRLFLLTAILCLVLCPLLLIVLGEGARLTRARHLVTDPLYEVPSRLLDQACENGVPPTVASRLEQAFRVGPPTWFDLWVVDAAGHVLSANQSSPLPIPPERYLTVTEHRPEYLWDKSNDNIGYVVRPLRGGKYWAVFRLNYPGSNVERIVWSISSMLFLQSILVSGIALFFLLLYLRWQARKARRVIGELKAGTLDSRFKVGTVDEIGSLMLAFNEMADEISGLVKKVQAGEKERTELLQFLAHDIRTPLTSLRLIAENVAEGEKPAARKKTARLLLQELGFFERMTEDLFFLAEIHEKPEEENESFALIPVIQEESDRALQLAKTKLRMELSLPDRLAIKGREALFRRLLRNLLDNGSRYAQGEISVSLRQASDGLRLTVRDNGKGFSAEALANYGKRRPVRYRSRSEQDISLSLGLGSVIATEIAKRYGGAVAVRNWLLPAGTIGGGEVEIHFPANIVDSALPQPSRAA